LLATAAVFAILAILTLPAPGLPSPAPRWGPSGRIATMPASTRYAAGKVRRVLLGDGYRDLWGTAIQASVLDLSSVAGGLSPVREGGGRQTRSLHLRGGDGREYVFRSVDKDQATGLAWLRRHTIGRLRQDQVSALHPAAALAAASLAEAAGIPHTRPVLVVMPDAARLGGFRAEFGGMLGILEEHADEVAKATPGSAPADQVVSTEDLWPHLARHPDDRVDEHAFLAARLFDVFLGDWDRHGDQWRWARLKESHDHVWIPIPRDRDYAFSNYGGILSPVARLVDPKVVRFDADYRDVHGLVQKSRPLDTALLCRLPLPVWDSVAHALADSLSNRAIDNAVRQMPVEYVRSDGRRFTATLRARRDRLPSAARQFQRFLARSSCDVLAPADN
jgi:hypothetical protein